MSQWTRWTIPFVVSAIAATGAFACSDDEGGGGGGNGTGNGDAGANGMTNGATNGMTNGATNGMTNGATNGMTNGATNGMTNGATNGMTGDAGDPYTCIANQAANDPDPGGSEGADADCCSGLGTCTATGDLSGDPNAGAYGHDECDKSADLVCAPKDESELPDGGATPSCTIAFGDVEYEGRCIPKCFVVNQAGASNLSAGDCPTDAPQAMGEEVVCAPCYSPLDGSETGACSRLPGDAPVEDAPEAFAECGSFGADDAGMGGTAATGYCVPEQTVMESGQSQSALDQLVQDSCEMGELCVPKTKVEDVSSCFETCEQPLDPNGQGTCVPSYIVENTMAGAVDLVGQQTCAEGESCAPCISPLDNMSTGACDN